MLEMSEAQMITRVLEVALELGFKATREHAVSYEVRPKWRLLWRRPRPAMRSDILIEHEGRCFQGPWSKYSTTSMLWVRRE